MSHTNCPTQNYSLQAPAFNLQADYGAARNVTVDLYTPGHVVLNAVQQNAAHPNAAHLNAAYPNATSLAKFISAIML